MGQCNLARNRRRILGLAPFNLEFKRHWTERLLASQSPPRVKDLLRSQEVFEETIDNYVRLNGRLVGGTIRHGNTAFEAEDAIDCDGVIEREPVSRRILRTTRYKKRPRRHQGLQLVEIHASFAQYSICTRPRIGCTG